VAELEDAHNVPVMIIGAGGIFSRNKQQNKEMEMGKSKASPKSTKVRNGCTRTTRGVIGTHETSL
jgi:hypothetical protein